MQLPASLKVPKGMKPVLPTDAGFLLLEKRNQPMHVGGLILATPPKGARKDFITKLIRSTMEFDQPHPPFNQRLRRRAGIWFWEEDKDFDIEAHVHHLSLPAPGRIRELLTLVSKLHSSLMDRSRPLWEVYIIEGVEGNRIAMYTKLHHAMVDGVAAMRMMQRATSEDPNAVVIPLWAQEPKQRGRSRPLEKANPLQLLVETANTLRETSGSARRVATELLKAVKSRRNDPDFVSVYQAPKSIFNQRITGGRRFAAQSWPLDRIKAAGKRHDATLNDVVLAMCASALRKYLIEINELPKKPLIAMVPVSMRKDDSASGNQVAMLLANLGTHQADPIERLNTIIRSMNNGKERFSRMSQGEIMAYLSAIMAAHSINMVLGIAPSWQAFNIVISNVPGPRNTVYLNGARIDGSYPMSIPIDGSAMNITLNSYAGNLDFGIIGCRRSVPHLQRLLQYLEEGLAELEQ